MADNEPESPGFLARAWNAIASLPGTMLKLNESTNRAIFGDKAGDAIKAADDALLDGRIGDSISATWRADGEIGKVVVDKVADLNEAANRAVFGDKTGDAVKATTDALRDGRIGDAIELNRQANKQAAKALLDKGSDLNEAANRAVFGDKTGDAVKAATDAYRDGRIGDGIKLGWEADKEALEAVKNKLTSLVTGAQEAPAPQGKPATPANPQPQAKKTK